ncbi:MAG: hypothetical protein COA49_00885 [Bacteroidetes bacterium]|nr:MAG: hypothetical protein COA49_00885 [Bacteroidota bacterium]
MKVKLNAESMLTSEIRTTLSRSGLCTRVINSITLAFITFFVITFSSCGNHKWEIDPSKVVLDKEFSCRNFIYDIENLDENDSIALVTIRNKYGSFWEDYSEDIIRIGNARDPKTISELRKFMSHPDSRATFEAIDTTSGKESYLESVGLILENGFKRFHAFMPHEPVPDIIWMNSAFNYAIYPREEYIAVGLEWFMGPDHPIVGLLPPDLFPRYQQLRMHPDLMASDAIKGWMLVHFSSRGYTGERCIDDILYWGKIMWLLDKCLPESYEHVLMDWSPEDLVWAKSNESAIWIELQPSNVIFETNRTIYNRWLSDGPFTKAGAIPQESPDRLGVWMGWQIVEDYMAENPEVTIDELFSESNYLPFLKSYRPQR